MFGRSLNKYTSNERKPVQIFPWVEKKRTSLHLAHKWNSFFLKHQFWCVLRHQSHTWSLVSEDLFLVTTSSTFEGSKKALLFCHNRIFRVYHICNETCPEKKKNEASTHCCFWKTNLKITVERRQNHSRQSQLIFQKTFRTLPQKWRNFQGCLFFLLWVEAQNEIGRNSFRNDWC